MIKMNNQTTTKILEVLREGRELDSIVIRNRIGLTYDSTAKHLKIMTEEGLIERKAKGRSGHLDGYSDGRKHWAYYYSLKEQK